MAEDKEQDIAFLNDQRYGNRVGSLGPSDERFKKANCEQQERIRKEDERFKRAGPSLDVNKNVSNEDDDDQECSESIETNDQDYEENGAKKKKPKFVTIKVPTKVLTSSAAVTAKRFKISTVAQTHLVADLITSAGGDLSDFTLSQSSAWRAGVSAVKSSAENIRQSFKEGVEGRCLVAHFDGKIVKEFTEGRKQANNRCAVLVSSPNLDAPQLLGVPVVASASGRDQARYINTELSKRKARI